MNKIKFALIGSGWRAEFYIRIAKLIPDRFQLTEVLIRDKEKGEQFAQKFGVKVVNTLDELLSSNPDYVVLSIKRGIVTDYLLDLIKKGIPVLCETPPGETVESLEQLWQQCVQHNAKVQVAEQYFLQPLYSAWLKVIQDGKLGELSNINISSLHGYHGVSMIRKMLGLSYENCTIIGKRFSFEVTDTIGREGMTFEGNISSYKRDRLTMEFENGKVAFFDFSDPAQYHSFIRTRQLTVQGVRGEIDDLTVRYLTSDNVSVTQELNRIDLGRYNNQEWSHLGIMLGEEFLYKNPFVNARLNDDEIAVASCMLKMGEYVRSGQSFYSMEEALQDTYISLMMEEALQQPDQQIVTSTQAWAKQSK